MRQILVFGGKYYNKCSFNRQQHLGHIFSIFIKIFIMCRRQYYIYQFQLSMIKILLCFFVAISLTHCFSKVSLQAGSPSSNLDIALGNILRTRALMGIQLEVTNRTHTLYHGNFGSRDNVNPMTNDSMFRIASCSKSIAAAAVMLLVQQKKVALNQSLTSIFGFPVKNPNFPDVDITVEMALSHQSSLIQCEPYYTNFLVDTTSKTGSQIPSIKQILVEGGKYYNKCLYSATAPPGTHYQYVNLNFGIAGTIVQKVSGIRFDLFLKERILRHISVGLSENATFYPHTITNISHLGIIFEGQNGKWVPTCDYYSSGVIPEKNLTGYVIGTNGVIFGPQGSLRASVSHMSNYITMLANGGVTKQGTRVLSAQSVQQMLKPRYQYHGPKSGASDDFHTYGFGLYTTTYRKSDQVIPHQVVRGHTGSAYGLISGYYFWGNYTMTYIVNGALNGYGYGTGTIYEKQRLLIYEAVTNYVNQISSNQEA